MCWSLQKLLIEQLKSGTLISIYVPAEMNVSMWYNVRIFMFRDEYTDVHGMLNSNLFFSMFSQNLIF